MPMSGWYNKKYQDYCSQASSFCQKKYLLLPLCPHCKTNYKKGKNHHYRWCKNTFSQSFGKIDSLPVEYKTLVDPNVLPSPTWHMQGAHLGKTRSEVQLNEITTQGIVTPQIEPMPRVSSLTYPHKANRSPWICLNHKDLNKATVRSSKRYQN